MLRRHALAALALGAISEAVACRDSSALSPFDAPDLDRERDPGEDRAHDDVKHHTVAGGGGCMLHVIETGNVEGQPILFLHGFSQNALTWTPQLRSTLGRRHRLLAMDLRGHGASDRPRSGYDDSRLWAEDVDATIRTLSLDHPVLCGWSYGPFVMLDYVRHFGEDAIDGLHFVDGITKLGSAAALAVLTPEMLALVPGFFSSDAEASVAALDSLLRLCFARLPAPAELYEALGYNVAVPPFVRQGLFGRTVDNDDLLPTIRKPVLITHGALDAVVRLEVVEQHRRLIPQAKVDIIAGAGHAPFRDAAPSFNDRLAAFCDEIARGARRSS